MEKKLILLLFLSLFHIITSNTSVSFSINIEDILTQKCFSAENIQTNENTKIIQINNNSTSNTIFIQYKYLTNIVISETINDDSTVIFKDSENLGSYYLNMKSAKNNYYITITPKADDYQICFVSFPNLGKEFEQDSKNLNIKTATYGIINSANLTYFIENFNLKQNKAFYTIRFDQNILAKINMPKIQMLVYFINSQRQQELISINNWYLQNNYYYAPFYIPKSNYTEKFTKIIFSMNIELKQVLTNNEILQFDLELIDSQEITCEYNINIVPNNEKDIKDKIFYPKVYFIDIQKNIFEFDRDILLLKQDSENKYINPFFTSNININNDNSMIVKKNLIDINKDMFLASKNSQISNPQIHLLIFILDENCNLINEEENVFISFRFYGGYHDLLHYQEGTTVQKFFNEEKNKILIKMQNCRPQYFFNYFNQKNENINDERILDIESSLGNMDLFYMNQIKGKNLEEYFNNLEQHCVHKFENSILTGNFGALEVSCPDYRPVLSYIYGHKKNLKEDFINFIDQKALIYIEYNTQYSLKFNTQEMENEFDFRIKILRTNVKEEDYKIQITYDNQDLNLDKENCVEILKHTKNSESNILIKVDSNSISSEGNTDKKGFILEILKGIDIIEDNILYVETETENEEIKANEVIMFIYGKNEINSAYNKIELLNTFEDKTTKIKICVHSGKGKYPFILKPLCIDEEENIIINPGESFILNYNNPYVDGVYEENEQFYVSLSADNNLQYNYSYEREINLGENTFENINHKGKKIYKLSSQKNSKKSMYYQINICENKNSNFNYIINNSDNIAIENDIYQECSLEEIKSFLIEFEGDGTQKAKFKYFYGPDKLLKKIEKFSKEICLSKSEDDKGLLIKFQTPFVQQIDVKIIFVLDSSIRYNNYCDFEKFCKENYDSKNIILIEKKIYVKDGKGIVCIDKKEIKDVLNQDVDIYLIAKSVVNNLEIFYDVKSLNLKLNQLTDSENEENEENKNYICINCGFNAEQKDEQKDIQNINKDDENKEDNRDENNEDNKENDKERKKDEDKDEQKNNDADQPLINQVPINVNNNNNENNYKNENNKEDNNEKENDNENNEENNKENEKEYDNKNQNINNNENYYDNKEKTGGSKNTRNNNDDDNEFKKKNLQNRDGNYNRNNIRGKDRTKNHEDDRDGDIDNDNGNNDHDNDNDHDQDNDHEQDNPNNQNNDDFNKNDINKNNYTNDSESINENQINNQNQIVKEMRNDININNNSTMNDNNNLKNVQIEGNKNGTNNTISNVLIGEGKTEPKKKSRKLLFFILIVLIGVAVYCIRNQCNNSENVSYSKISKYSYYDF